MSEMNERGRAHSVGRCILVAASLASVVLESRCTTTTRTLPACTETQASALTADTPDAGIVVAAVGDIADCNGGKQVEVAAAIEKVAPAAVLALGDLAYQDGSLDDFLDCYDPSFGRFRPITHPVVGNHEYHTPHAGPYWAYFCGAAGPTFHGWYSFDIGKWHVVALNSVCGSDLDVDSNASEEFGGCDESSSQVAWLRADLAAHPAVCKLAMWHHPRWSSSSEGATPQVEPFWRALVEAKVDVILNGHAHDYQRFPPMNVEGEPDPTGPRTFVVGTGGSPFSPFDEQAFVRSEVRSDTSHGFLKLVLRDHGYAWSFVPITGDTLHDEGEAPCHP